MFVDIRMYAAEDLYKPFEDHQTSVTYRRQCKDPR
jgi:hypothetical protein